MRFLSRGGVAALLVTCGVAISAAPALADSSTIAGAPTIVPGQQNFGNLASITPDSDDCASAFWLLPETAGDTITINWETQTSATHLSVYPSGTSDFNVDSADSLQDQGPAENNRNQLTFQITSDGTLPVRFDDNGAEGCETGAAGPYDFTVSITHDMVVSVGTLPAALSGTATVGLDSPDGSPLGAPLTGFIQVSANGFPWTTIGQAAAANGAAVVPYAIPATLAGKTVKLRAVGNGPGYTSESSAPQTLKLPAAPPAPAPAPAPAPSPKWTSCQNYRYTPGPAISFTRELGLSCTELQSLVSRVQITGQGHWVLHGRHWGLSGGAGVGHYGVKVSGYRCTVLKELHGLSGRQEETTGMNVTCTAGSRKFGFVWDSWITGFSGRSPRLHGRIWGAIE
jgi:hypothetical protein